MKQYEELKIEIEILNSVDVVRTSGKLGDNTLPWVDVEVDGN